MCFLAAPLKNQTEFQIILHSCFNSYIAHGQDRITLNLCTDSTGNLLDKATLLIHLSQTSICRFWFLAVPQKSTRDCLANDRTEEASVWKDLWGDGRHLFDDFFVRWWHGSRSKILVTQYHCLFTRRLIGRRCYWWGRRHDSRASRRRRFLVRLQCYVSVDVWWVAWRTGRRIRGSVFRRGGSVGWVLALAPTQFGDKTDDDAWDDCCANDPSRNVDHHQDYVLCLTRYSWKTKHNRVIEDWLYY